MLLFIYVLLILAVVLAVTSIIKGIIEPRVKGGKRALRQVSIAERSLRAIANGSANPVLEAQIALDEITGLYETKELN